MSFVAIDWGSTQFRAYRVVGAGVAERIVSPRGIAALAPEALEATLVGELAPWREWIERERVPVLMAGMIGSNRGLRDAGYQRLPVDLDALASSDARVEVKTSLATTVSIRAGLALAHGDAFDVMRGEEVQLCGACRLRPASLYVFPGTHSKWVPVEHSSGRAQVRAFSTMMTGELYAWLVDGSLVCRGIPEPRAWRDWRDWRDWWNEEAFARGVARAAGDANVVEEIFRTRARWLLGDLAPAAAPSFLSGLLIGHELSTMTRRHSAGDALVVVGAERLCALYQRAARQVGVATEIITDEDAVVAGFRRMHEHE